MQLEVTVCDVAPQSEVGVPTQHYKLERVGGQRVERDLCDEHAAPIEALMQLEQKSRPKSTARKTAATRKRTGRKVVSLEEIESMKR